MAQPNLLYVCEICQTILEEHHCKAICPNCGRTFDCSDLPIMYANARVSSEDASILLRPGSDVSDWIPTMEESAPNQELDVNEMENRERKDLP